MSEQEKPEGRPMVEYVAKNPEAARMWLEILADQLDDYVAMRAAILALAAELDGQAIVGMGVKDIAKRLRGIAG